MKERNKNELRKNIVVYKTRRAKKETASNFSKETNYE